MKYFADPYEELKSYCLAHDYKLIYMDIEVLDVLSEVTYANLKTQTLPMDALGQFDIDEVFIDAVSIKQTFAFKPIKAPTLKADFRLAADKTVSKVAAVFYAEQCDLDASDDELVAEIEQNILRKLIKSRLFVGIRKLYNKDKILQAINQMRMGKLKVNLPIAKGVAAIEGKPARIIEHYKKRKSAENAATMRERGFMYPARLDDLIVEYSFATPNRNGRNLLGQEIKSELIRASREVPFKVDESLKEERDNESARFYAIKPGFVEYIAHKAQYVIKDEMFIKAASFKDTGSIDGGGKDTNVTLRINEIDAMSDAVGANVTLDVAKLKIDGSVAQNAVVKAVSASIGGQTHKLSKIFASECEIARHRGYAKGDEVKIDTLEGGVVEGKHVSITNALGGQVSADVCEVSNAKANTVYKITSSLKIQECNGNNLRINVTLAHDDKLKEKIAKIEEANKERELPLAQLPAQIAQKRAIIDKNRDSITAIQQKLRQFAEQGVPAPAAFAIKIKEFKAVVSEYNTLSEQLADLQAKQAHDDELLTSLQEKIFNAKVECLTPWQDGCEVRFELLNPQKTINWVSERNEIANLIYIARTDDGDVVIKKERY